MKHCMLGIDVSRWQGVVDWQTVAHSVDFAILKAGGSDAGFYTDKTFEYNYTNAIKAGLHVGAYYFVGKKCTSRKDGEADAKRFLKILGDKKFDMPVYMDFEAPSAAFKWGNTMSAVGFCEVMEEAGYFVGIYASDIAGFKDRLILDLLKPYSLWVARYGVEPKYVKDYGMWQVTSKGKIKGINTYVDLNYCYKDFPAIITSRKFNNY